MPTRLSLRPCLAVPVCSASALSHVVGLLTQQLQKPSWHDAAMLSCVTCSWAAPWWPVAHWKKLCQTGQFLHLKNQNVAKRQGMQNVVFFCQIFRGSSSFECGHLSITARRPPFSHQRHSTNTARPANFVPESRRTTTTFVTIVTSAQTLSVIGAQQLRCFFFQNHKYTVYNVEWKFDVSWTVCIRCHLELLSLKNLLYQSVAFKMCQNMLCDMYHTVM